ncbi:MAG: hypothetical protein JXM69_18595 [Anaerolineae bacterium]|nr:hypothetical protein [Anaerolineae bacterium]
MATSQANIVKSTARIAWLAFTTVMVIAFFCRFYRLADHPLGIFYDSAINGLDAVRLMQRGGHSVFIPTNGGREALIVYLLIPFIWLFDTTPFAVRALTATTSLLTVALLFGFLKSVSCLDFGAGRGRLTNRLTPPVTSTFPMSTNLRLATLAGLTLAVSYWDIVVGRLGVRAVLVALFSVPMFWLFLKGWVTNQKRWFILSGGLMGLIGYTYFAARLLPIILLLVVIPEFFIRPKERLSRHGSGLLAFVFSALVVYLPMAWYMITHPVQFTTRAFSVMVWNFLDTPADIVAEIGRNVWRVLGFFCCAGSPNPIFGVPGHPGLHPLLAPFLLIGLILALKNWRHIVYRLVACWWLIGLGASIIAIEAPHPLRLIVAVVPTAILAALGLISAFNWLQVRGSQWLSRLQAASPFALHLSRFTRHVLPWLPLVIILATVPDTFRTYFIDWTKLQATQGAYDYGAVAIRDAVLEHSADNPPIYLPLTRFNDSPLLFYLSSRFPRHAALAALPAKEALVIAPGKNQTETTWVRLQNGTAMVLPPLTVAGQQLVQTALTAGAANPIRTITGETAARLGYLATDPAQFLQQPGQPLAAIFGPVQLTGVNYPATINSTAHAVPVTLFWQAASQITDEYEVILHLVDDKHRVWGDGSGRPNDWVYPTTFWRPGLDEIAALQNVNIEAGPLPPGRYWLAVAMYDPVAAQRLPLTNPPSNSPDTLFVGPLKVALPPPTPIAPLAEEINFGEVIRLVGVEPNRLAVAAGEPVSIKLLWETLNNPKLDYTVFVHLLDQDDNIIAGHDTQPLEGDYPTSIWTPGERILDPHTLPTAASLPSGQYRLAIGLYYQPTGIRLPLNLAGGQAEPEGRLILPQRVTIMAPGTK